MKLNPPIVIGPVEFNSINEEVHSMSVMIHLVGNQTDLQNPQYKELISGKVQLAVKYLIDEGFIPGKKEDEWMLHIGAIFHGSTSTK